MRNGRRLRRSNANRRKRSDMQRPHGRAQIRMQCFVHVSRKTKRQHHRPNRNQIYMLRHLDRHLCVFLHHTAIE